jgi:phage recombination protein Bet
MSQETTQLAIPAAKASALALMAGKFNVEPKKLLETLKNTVFRGATDDELMTLVVVSNEYGLNPLLKEIYAFPAKGGGIVPVVSIDGWIRMMNDHPQFDGIDYEFEHSEDGKLIACTSIIYRKDRAKPVRVTEYMVECRRNTEPWKMEHRMLRHKATIQGARVAFGFSGITDEDEAQATPGLARDVTPTVARAVPLDPFTQTPPVTQPEAETPVVEAEYIQPAPEEPAPLAMEDNTKLLDLLDRIELANTADELTNCAVECAEIEPEAHRKLAKAAVVKKAKELELVWDKKTSQYLPV